MDYDYAGARIKKSGPLGLTVYPFPGYEIDADGVKIKYIQLGNELLAAKKSSGEKLFYHNDHLGGVNVISDVNGNRTELMEYDPWGKVSRQESTSNAVDPSHAFTGQELDKETELYFYDGRYYDQQLARFVQPDPFVVKPNDPQNFNRYSYVLNNPYHYIDPTGYDDDDTDDNATAANDQSPSDQDTKENNQATGSAANEGTPAASAGTSATPELDQELNLTPPTRDLNKDKDPDKDKMDPKSPKETMVTPDKPTKEFEDKKMSEIMSPVREPTPSKVGSLTIIEEFKTRDRSDISLQCAGGCYSYEGKVYSNHEETVGPNYASGINSGGTSMSGPLGKEDR